MRRRKRDKLPALSDGWYWCLLWVNLRGGHYHREWLPARVEGDTVRLFGSDSAIPLSAPVLANALWSGPLDPPPLEHLPGTALTPRRAWNRQRRNQVHVEAGSNDRTAAKAQAVAEGIVDAFLGTVESLGVYYHEHPDHRAALVEKIAGVIERAFGGPSGAEEA